MERDSNSGDDRGRMKDGNDDPGGDGRGGMNGVVGSSGASCELYGDRWVSGINGGMGGVTDPGGDGRGGMNGVTDPGEVNCELYGD